MHACVYRRRQACEQVTASDGSNCVWCTGTHAPSACLSTKDAKIADDKFGLSCPSVNEDVTVTTEEVEVSDQPNIDPGMIDTTCFMAAFNAENAEEACGTTEAQDGSQCVWCETQGDTMGACFTASKPRLLMTSMDSLVLVRRLPRMLTLIGIRY